MANPATLLPQNQSLSEIAAFYQDVTSAIRYYYTGLYPDFERRFVGYDQEKLITELGDRLREINFQSCLITLAALEAAFRLDYKFRCERRKRDPLSRVFRELYRARVLRVSLEEEIFEGWKIYSTASPSLIGELKAAFNFRHWLAHGRHSISKPGRKYDFAIVYDLADRVLATFPLYR